MYFFRDSSAKQLPAFKDPCFELAMARRKEDARWGWIPFAVFVLFLLVYRFFGLVMPSNNADGSQSWLFLLVLAGWGLLALVHMVVIPIWMLIASLHYWEVNRRGLTVAGLLSAWFSCCPAGPCLDKGAFSVLRGGRCRFRQTFRIPGIGLFSGLSTG